MGRDNYPWTHLEIVIKSGKVGFQIVRLEIRERKLQIIGNKENASVVIED
jgi:hypothetical protein